MSAPSPSRRRLVGTLLLLLPVIAGCSSTPPPKLYTLAPRPATPANQLAATVSVRQVGVAPYLDRPQIVRYSSPYEMSASEFNRWGEGMSDMVTRVLVENLAERLPASQVYAAAGPLTLPGADITIEVNIPRFDADAGGTVILAAQWVVHSGSGKKAKDQFHAQQFRVAPPSNDTAGQVAAMSDALGQLASQIATTLPT